MPPKTRYTREQVEQAAFSIAREKGLEGLNARAIAKRLGCSTQPLYRDLNGMEEIRRAVLLRATRFFESYVRENSAQAALPYLGSGLAYLRFAKEETRLFSLLFMRSRSSEEQTQGARDATFEYAAAQISAQLHYSLEKAREFHYQSYIYVHGLAAMIATGFLDYDEAALAGLLRRQYRALRLAFEAEG